MQGNEAHVRIFYYTRAGVYVMENMHVEENFRQILWILESFMLLD